MKNNYKAFTLAEVLIALGIIGIVASLTLPAIIQKQNEKATVTALKKFYSSISQAFTFANLEYGTPDNWYAIDMTQAERSMIVADNLTKFMKISKNCHNNSGCFYDGTFKSLDGRNFHFNGKEHARFVTSDGMSILINGFTTTEMQGKEDSFGHVYADIIVDVNGYKKPNTLGKDTFSFIMLRDKIIPSGLPEHIITSSEESVSTFPDDCNTRKCSDICESCTAWVIYNENLDYLHCDDLSWQGKKTCK